jgi:addiction module RelE/StbE family toxin
VKIVYTQRALDDLERLIEFVEHLHPAEIEATGQLIVQAVEILASHPLIGRRTSEHLRELVISRWRTGYLALYRLDRKRREVQILAVRHQREAGYDPTNDYD